VNGVLKDDERHAIAAARRLGLLLSSDWPDLAVQLLVQGADGEATAELAGLPHPASPWSVDQLVPGVVAELAVPELSAAQAGDLAGRLFGMAAGARPEADDFAAIRGLARLCPGLDYPGGLIGDAYYASEWLDCECHADSPDRGAAIALENTLRTGEPLDIDPGLLRALSASWF
jgi:hypothetical protein